MSGTIEKYFMYIVSFNAPSNHIRAICGLIFQMQKLSLREVK